MSSELVGSDNERDHAQERLAAICFAIVASLFALALVAYWLWPKGTVDEVADPEPFGPSQTGPPKYNSEIKSRQSPILVDTEATICPRQGGQAPPDQSHQAEPDLALLARRGPDHQEQRTQIRTRPRTHGLTVHPPHSPHVHRT